MPVANACSGGRHPFYRHTSVSTRRDLATCSPISDVINIYQYLLTESHSRPPTRTILVIRTTPPLRCVRPPGKRSRAWLSG
eukprot:scaffold80990_cov52-Phaeocystis_antarctica.AAC.3